MTLDIPGLERAIVRHCSPTLAAMKPACLFNVPGCFRADPAQEPAARLASWRAARKLNARLDEVVGELSCRLAPAGVCLRVIARRGCGALVYVWRPDLLERSLSQAATRSQLEAWGYDTHTAGWVKHAITRLGHELESCHRHDAQAGFPHEVGLFLGYPYDDVMGFIEHRGKDFLCCGCWKVYSDLEHAQACFERYKRCTTAYLSLLDMGARLADLASVHLGEAA